MKRALLCLSALCCLFLSACSWVQCYQSQKLRSESSLYDVPLEHNSKVLLDGVWFSGTGNPCVNRQKVNFYVAPLNVTLVKDKYPDFPPVMVEQMDTIMTEALTKACDEANTANKTQWKVTHNEAEADISIELAVVSLRKQKPGLHIVAEVLGYVAPTGVGDAIGLIAEGDITLEGAIRDHRTGELLMAFKDSNRAKLRFYQKDAFLREGNVDANLRIWAEKLARVCRASAHDIMGSDNLKHMIEQRSRTDVIKTRLHESF